MSVSEAEMRTYVDWLVCPSMAVRVRLICSRCSKPVVKLFVAMLLATCLQQVSGVFYLPIDSSFKTLIRRGCPTHHHRKRCYTHWCLKSYVQYTCESTCRKKALLSSIDVVRVGVLSIDSTKVLLSLCCFGELLAGE